MNFPLVGSPYNYPCYATIPLGTVQTILFAIHFASYYCSHFFSSLLQETFYILLDSYKHIATFFSFHIRWRLDLLHLHLYLLLTSFY